MNTSGSPFQPIPLYREAQADPSAWACSVCGRLSKDQTAATWCCVRNVCRTCGAAKAEPTSSDCAVCIRKRRADHRERAREAVAQWRSLPNRAPISAYKGVISDADGPGDGYYQDLDALLDHCINGGPDPRERRFFAVMPSAVTWTAEELADEYVDQLAEVAHDGWEFDNREELVRLLGPVADLLTHQDLGWEEDRTRPLDFDIEWPPTPTPGALHVVGALIVRDGRVFAAQRAEHKHDGGRWEFPGGKPEGAESNEQALARELREELGADVEVGPWVARGTVVGQDPDDPDDFTQLELDLYLVRWPVGDPVLVDHCNCGWFRPSELRELSWCWADRNTLDRAIEVAQEQEPER